MQYFIFLNYEIWEGSLVLIRESEYCQDLLIERQGGLFASAVFPIYGNMLATYSHKQAVPTLNACP